MIHRGTKKCRTFYEITVSSSVLFSLQRRSSVLLLVPNICLKITFIITNWQKTLLIQKRADSSFRAPKLICLEQTLRRKTFHLHDVFLIDLRNISVRFCFISISMVIFCRKTRSERENYAPLATQMRFGLITFSPVFEQNPFSHVVFLNLCLLSIH